jgi:hypothetical protein
LKSYKNVIFATLPALKKDIQGQLFVLDITVIKYNNNHSKYVKWNNGLQARKSFKQCFYARSPCNVNNYTGPRYMTIWWFVALLWYDKQSCYMKNIHQALYVAKYMRGKVIHDFVQYIVIFLLVELIYSHILEGSIYMRKK